MGERHRFRANWHDYEEGLYFVTICSHNKEYVFGYIKESQFTPSKLGKLIDKAIKDLSSFYDDVQVCNYIIMPNHVHLVISVGIRLIVSADAGITHTGNLGCLRPPRHGVVVEKYHHNSRLATVIGAFKAGVTRNARIQGIETLPCWQSRYHEHIIRNQQSLYNIMNYIDTNVENWGNDCFCGK